MNEGAREAIETERIDWFFRKPASGNPDGSRRSNLFTLRRDLCELVQTEINLAVDPKVPMLAAIGMMSGIDLMAWTTTWPKEPGRMGFVAFLRKYGHLDESDAEALYQYRCAQTHSYGLFSISRKKGQPDAEFTFTLNPSVSAHLAIEFKPDAAHSHNYIVSLSPLKRLFLNMADEFENAVRSDTATRSTFLKAIEKVGFFYVKSDWWV